MTGGGGGGGGEELFCCHVNRLAFIKLRGEQEGEMLRRKRAYETVCMLLGLFVQVTLV